MSRNELLFDVSHGPEHAYNLSFDSVVTAHLSAFAAACVLPI